MKKEKAISHTDKTEIEALSKRRHKPLASKFFKDGVLGIAVLTFVGGSLVLAVIDENCRPIFADLTKICLGAYIGLLMPKG